MKRAVIGIAFATMTLAAGVTAAAPADDACAALMEARANLVAMLDTTDKAALDGLKAKVHAASARLEGIVDGMSGADAAKAKDFKAVWVDFKKTRENEIIAALYAGKQADAKAVATGIQAERMKKMKGIMGCK